uniref:Xylulose kinase-1 n=1 Tax=Tanacetum cinerariifolium TaxID=118510 RepID=A0A6L2L5N6_TANCI|nr:hypothetical protein [Tanacetum cinerariifolium]
MIAILEKYEDNTDFHQIVNFVEASHLRYALTYNPTVYVSHIRQFWSTARIETMDERTKILATIDGRTVPLFSSMLVTMGKRSGTPTKPHRTPTPEATPSLLRELSSSSLLPIPTEPLPTVIPSNTPPLKQYTRRTRIAQSLVLPPVADEPASPLGDDSQGKAYPTDSGFEADQDMANITKTSTFLSDSTPRVTSLAADEGREELDEGEEAVVERSTERGSDDTEEMVTVLTSLDAASIFTSGVSVSISPVTEVSIAEVPTGSGFIPSASPPESTPYTRRKGKEKMVESKTPKKKKKLQEQIDVQVMMIDGLDRNNETVAKYIQEYHQFVAELPIGRRIELISDLVKYQENYAKVFKFQTQQRKPLSRKQQRDFYMSVLRSHAGWKAKHFKGMTLEEIKKMFDPVWKQMQDFILMGSKEEGERFKRKGLRLEQESAKKVKITKEVPEEKLKEMMHLIPVEEAFVKETLNIRPAANDKEKELWVELKRLYEPDVEDLLWTHTQNLMHAVVEWKLYDTCGVHHVISKDQEMFMLVEKDYPLRKGLAILMISYKLQVENYSQMANDLILKIHKIANSPRQQDV